MDINYKGSGYIWDILHTQCMQDVIYLIKMTLNRLIKNIKDNHFIFF